MKSLLQNLERKLEPYAIPHLSVILALGQVAVFAMLVPQPELMFKLALIPNEVMAGQWYRLVSFLVVPPGIDILTLFCIYGFYFMGETLEVQWGTLRYNLYLLIAYLATVSAAWLNPAFPTFSAFIGGSVFLAFAWLYPDFIFQIYFVIPIKAKYLALITWVAFFFSLTFGAWPTKVAVIASVANFLLFFGRSIVWRILHGKKMMEMSLQLIRRQQKGIHRCAICGLTERDDHTVDFRYCSKCEGMYEYCEIHLKDHEHQIAAKPVK